MSDTTKDADRPRERKDSELWVVVSSESGLSTMPLPRRSEIVFGRAPGCDVVIDDDSISRRHAVLRGRSLFDLGSRNGTTVFGRRLAEGEGVVLEPGSVVELGSVIVVLLAGKPVRRTDPAPAASVAIVRDPVMKRLYAMADVLASSQLPLLILGETGTGKEVFAETVHMRSPRRSGPLLRLNCAGLTGSLLEAELFGYERGAFTGATAAKAGLFEAASGGTMFLDEVGELPLETQAKLLRVLESGEVHRLGGLKPRPIDVRYLSATNRDLEVAVREGSFRRDLFFRLNGFSVTLPPLRLRTSEILPLAEHFLARCRERSGGASSIGHAAAKALLDYEWPGNVRELRHVVDRAHVLAAGTDTIESAHLLFAADGPSPKKRTRGYDLERDEVVDALRRTNGNQTYAAKLLGVARRTLINRMESFGLERPRKPAK